MAFLLKKKYHLGKVQVILAPILSVSTFTKLKKELSADQTGFDTEEQL